MEGVVEERGLVSWRWRAGTRQPEEEQRQVVGRGSRERRATARMDGACGGSCSALPGNRRPRAGIGVGAAGGAPYYRRGV